MQEKGYVDVKLVTTIDSVTLRRIMFHLDPDLKLTDGVPLNFPFNLEQFCAENDQNVILYNHIIRNLLEWVDHNGELITNEDGVQYWDCLEGGGSCPKCETSFYLNQMV